MFRLHHKDQTKRNLILGVLSKNDAEEWVKSFLPKTKELFEEQNDSRTVRFESTIRPSQQVMFFTNRKSSSETPKAIDSALKTIREVEDWQLVADGEWVSGK